MRRYCKTQKSISSDVRPAPKTLLFDTENLEKYKSNLVDLGYKIEIAIGYGSPAKAICEVVKSKELDLLVMGVHGHSGISDLIFGTTVEKVRHHVKIPVLIVK